MCPKSQDDTKAKFGIKLYTTLHGAYCKVIMSPMLKIVVLWCTLFAN